MIAFYTIFYFSFNNFVIWYFTNILWIFHRVSVEHARGTPRGSDRYYDSSYDRYPPSRRGGGGGGGRRSSARDK